MFDLTLKERNEKVVECDQMSFSLRHSRLNSSADFEFKKDSTLILMTCLTSKVHWWRRQTRSKCQSLRHLLSSHHAHQRRSTAALFIIQFVILSHIVFISYFLLASSKTYGNYYTPRKWIYSYSTMFSLNSIDKLGNTQAASSSICSTQGSKNRQIVQQLVIDSTLSQFWLLICISQFHDILIFEFIK